MCLFCVLTLIMLTQFLKILLAHNARVAQKNPGSILQYRRTSRDVEPTSHPNSHETWAHLWWDPIWGTQNAIFNLFSFILELKKRDFRTSRIQKISKLDIFNLVGQKNSRNIVLDPEGKYLPKSELSLFICPYPGIGCTRLSEGAAAETLK